MKHREYFRSTDKIWSQTLSITKNTLRKLTGTFLIYAELKYFLVRWGHFQLYKSGEQWQGSRSGLVQLHLSCIFDKILYRTRFAERAYFCLGVF